MWQNFPSAQFSIVPKNETYTQADGRQETQGGLRGQAGGEERLQDIVGEGESDDGLAGRVNH